MKLYKYRNININLLQSLRKKTIWFSKLEFLNDPFDCFYINNTNSEAYETLLSEICVCCFSKNMNEIIMWSHYAENHKGVCLEFEITNENVIKSQLFDINYNNELSVFDNIERAASGHLKLNLTSNGKFLVTKFENWRYEDEVRAYAMCEKDHTNGREMPFLGNLTSIYFGKHTNEDDVALIKHNTSHIESLKFFKVDLDTKSMKIEINRQI